jgi:hypothetical protein
MTMAAATRNSSPKQRASRSIAAPDNLRLDTLRHHRPERDVGLRADHEWMRFSRFPVLQTGQPVGRGVEDRVVLKLDIDLHPQSISRRRGRCRGRVRARPGRRSGTSLRGTARASRPVTTRGKQVTVRSPASRNDRFAVGTPSRWIGEGPRV